MRDSIVFYNSWLTMIQRLPIDKRGEAYDVVMNYAFKGEEPQTDDIMLLMIFDAAKPQIDKNNQRYENAKKGGAPKGNQNARKQPKTTKAQPKNNQKQPNVNENVNVNDNANYIKCAKFNNAPVRKYNMDDLALQLLATN